MLVKVESVVYGCRVYRSLYAVASQNRLVNIHKRCVWLQKPRGDFICCCSPCHSTAFRLPKGKNIVTHIVWSQKCHSLMPLFSMLQSWAFYWVQQIILNQLKDWNFAIDICWPMVLVIAFVRYQVDVFWPKEQLWCWERFYCHTLAGVLAKSTPLEY